MQINILSEYGVGEAIYGLGLSYGRTSDLEDEDLTLADVEELGDSLYTTALSLAGKGEGHDKFLRMLMVTLDIKAPLYWWKEFDTYKIGTVAQSESTMHTLMKKPIVARMFAGGMDEWMLEHLEAFRQSGDFTALNRHLPHSFLQRRVVMTSYATLANIIRQRRRHKLMAWRLFCDAVLHGVEHPDLLDKAVNHASTEE